MSETPSSSPTAQAALTAIGGAPDGAGTSAGWLVAVRFDDDVLDVFTQNGSHRFHAAFITRFEVTSHPSPSGMQLTVQATAQGCAVPTSFTPAQLQNIRAITEAIAQARVRLGYA